MYYPMDGYPDHENLWEFMELKNENESTSLL